MGLDRSKIEDKYKWNIKKMYKIKIYRKRYK